MTRPGVLYLRVSTQRQADADKFGLDVQERIARSYADREGISIQKIYVDKITGKAVTRDQLEVLKREVPSGSDVVISSVDRLARDIPVGYQTYGELRAAGFNVHAAEMGQVDLEDETSALNFGIRMVMADAERRKITNRMYGGILEKARRGLPPRKIRAYGWKNGEIDHDEAEWVRYIFEQLLSTGAQTVASRLNALGVVAPQGGAWTSATISYIAKEPIYKGEHWYGKKNPVLVAVPALVSRETWEAVQRATADRANFKSKPTRRSDLYPLGGRIRCGVCGAHMSGRKRTRPGREPLTYYVCARVAVKAKHLEHPCTHRTYHHAHEIHEAVLAALRGIVNDDGALRAVATMAPLPGVDTTRAQRELEKRLTNLKNGVLAGFFDAGEAVVIKHELEDKIAALEAEALVVPARLDYERIKGYVEQILSNDTSLESFARNVNLKVTIHPTGEFDLSLGEGIAEVPSCSWTAIHFRDALIYIVQHAESRQRLPKPLLVC